MNKTVIIARPHQMIVENVKTYLKRNNYSPFRLEALSDLNKLEASDKIHGAIISTAVTSVVKESYQEVFIEVRNRYPNLPIIFTTIVNLEAMSELLKQSFIKVIPDINFFYLNEEALRKNTFNPDKNFLLVDNKSLTDSKNTTLANEILNSYFN